MTLTPLDILFLFAIVNPGAAGGLLGLLWGFLALSAVVLLLAWLFDRAAAGLNRIHIPHRPGKPLKHHIVPHKNSARIAWIISLGSFAATWIFGLSEALLHHQVLAALVPLVLISLVFMFFAYIAWTMMRPFFEIKRIP